MSAKQSRNSMDRRKAARRGATVVEFAITAPLFLLFLMAAFEFGWLNVMRHTANNAAYEAARHVIVPGAKAAEGVARAQSILNAVGARNTNVTITPSNITTGTKEVTVTVEIPVDSNALVTPKFAGKKVIRSSSTLRTERVQ